MMVLITYDISFGDVGGQQRLRRIAKHCLDCQVLCKSAPRKGKNIVEKCTTDIFMQIVKLSAFNGANLGCYAWKLS